MHLSGRERARIAFLVREQGSQSHEVLKRLVNAVLEV
jgi:hypothetical protein